MPDRVTPGPLRGNQTPREAVSVHTRRVYDSCRDKECLQDIRVYLTRCSQMALDGSINVKAKGCQLLWAYVDVEPVPFKKGYYTVDVHYYYKVTADACGGSGRTREISGLATFDKKTVLFGSEGSVRIFSSQLTPGSGDLQNAQTSNLPIAVAEVVDPVLLGLNVTDTSLEGELVPTDLPETIFGFFDDELIVGGEGRRLYATLGQFSIIRLERDIQLVMPAYNVSMPEHESACDADDPCDLFRSFSFPVEEFFPPRMDETAPRRCKRR